MRKCDEPYPYNGEDCAGPGLQEETCSGGLCGDTPGLVTGAIQFDIRLIIDLPHCTPIKIDSIITTGIKNTLSVTSGSTRDQLKLPICLALARTGFHNRVWANKAVMKSRIPRCFTSRVRV
ncbi:hypothetical protein PoB_006790700 [Plakobranchus ocellatus]|uniref:Uncharacterized protein n=1 Tax=Plakobranchus ocellatus TaxID=259542 RepID=A0AAV4DAV7_9GAST|nr:hypothetical protein PoB_006790700 [Plakobranchus ocellatus]